MSVFREPQPRVPSKIARRLGIDPLPLCALEGKLFMTDIYIQSLVQSAHGNPNQLPDLQFIMYQNLLEQQKGLKEAIDLFLPKTTADQIRGAPVQYDMERIGSK